MEHIGFCTTDIFSQDPILIDFFSFRHNIPMGLHANLSEGVPVCPSLQQASTLTNQRGFFHGKTGFRQALEGGQLSMKQVHCSNVLACINLQAQDPGKHANSHDTFNCSPLAGRALTAP